MATNPYFLSDHHFSDAKAIQYEDKYRPQDITDHDEWLIAQHNSVVRPESIVWFGGDLCRKMDPEKLVEYLRRMNGRKNILFGNHDDLPIEFYAEHFEKVRSYYHKGPVVVTHVPIHPTEFNYRKDCDINLHGHLHSRSLIHDDRYVNMCVEKSDGIPRTISQWLENR